MTSVSATSVALPGRDGASRRTRIRPADGVRGLAALAVVAHHASFITGRSFDGDVLGSVNARLDVGVAVFFVLSGFLLFEPYAERIVDDEPLPSRWRFWRRRAVRIFPAYWAALLIQLAIGAIAVGGVVGFLVDAALIQIYIEEYVLTGIVQAWTLATEVGFYILLPFAALLAARLAAGRTTHQRLLVMWGLCAVYVVLSVVSRGLFEMFDLPGHRVYRFSVIANADYFGVGMAFAVLMVGARRSANFSDLHTRMFAKPWWWYTAAAFVLWVTSTQLGIPVGLAVGPVDVEMARQAGYLLVALLVVGPACCCTDDRAWSMRFLGSRPLVLLGAVSYGLYLWHQVFLVGAGTNEGWIFAWTGWTPFDAPFFPVFALAAIGGTALGAVSWYALERPLLRRFG